MLQNLPVGPSFDNCDKTQPQTELAAQVVHAPTNKQLLEQQLIRRLCLDGGEHMRRCTHLRTYKYQISK